MGYGYTGRIEYLVRSLHKSSSEEAIADAENFNFSSVNNIIELMTLPTNNDIVLLEGYFTKMDMEEGLFYYDETEPKANHNGGTIIDPTKTFPVDWTDETLKKNWYQINNEGMGCWKRKFEYLKSDYFGTPYGDSNGYALTSWAKSIEDNSIVYLNGNHIAHNTINFRDGITNVKITGKSYIYSTAVRLTNLYQGNNVIVEGIHLKSAHKYHWSDSSVIGAVIGFTMSECSEITLQHCIFENIKEQGVIAFGGRNLTVTYCDFRDIGGNCISVDNQWDTEIRALNTTVTNNKFKGCYDSFVGMHNADGFRVQNNFCEKTGYDSEFIKGDTGFGIDIPGSMNGTVSGNIIIGPFELSEEHTAGLAIHVHGYNDIPAKNIAVTGNNIIGTTGITFGEIVVNSTCNNNNFSKPINGIYIGDALYNCIFNGNTISEAKDCAIKGNSANNRENVFITNNKILDSLDTAITFNAEYVNSHFSDNYINKGMIYKETNDSGLKFFNNDMTLYQTDKNIVNTMNAMYKKEWGAVDAEYSMKICDVESYASYNIDIVSTGLHPYVAKVHVATGAKSSNTGHSAVELNKIGDINVVFEVKDGELIFTPDQDISSVILTYSKIVMENY